MEASAAASGFKGCAICGGLGHRATQCPKLQLDNGAQDEKKQSQKSMLGNSQRALRKDPTASAGTISDVCSLGRSSYPHRSHQVVDVMRVAVSLSKIVQCFGHAV
eukprot:1161222-Pelagomonas_calceolata.AAC.2